MALLREIDEFCNWTIEELVDEILDLREKLDGYEDLESERDELQAELDYAQERLSQCEHDLDLYE